MFQSRILLRLGLALALVLTLGAGRASADIQVYDLTVSNLANPPYVGPFATVTVDLTDSTHATITFDSLTDANGFTYLFHSNGGAGVNVNATSWTLGSITTTNAFAASNPGIFNATAGPGSDGGSKNLDGFGVYNQTIDLADGFKASASEISFVLTDTSGTWANAASVLGGTDASGNPISAAAAQIGAWVQGESDFRATGFADHATQVTTPPPPPPNGVPEPSTMALAALGGLGFLGYGLRRRLKK